MIPEYDLSKLEEAMHDFNRATGVSITLYDTLGNPVTCRGMGSCEYCKYVATFKEGRRSCKKSNKELLDRCKRTMQPAKHICGAGLLDISIPLLHGNEIVGYLMIGQIKISEELPRYSFDPDYERISSIYSALPLFDEERIDSIINIATMLTKYIMLENMVRSRRIKSADAIANYVDAHLEEHLSAESVALGTHISKSGIYKCMKQNYGCTLGEFIASRRIERAKAMLADNELSVARIAEAVGFTDTSYFSRSFKRNLGISPIKYRNMLKGDPL